MTEFWLGVLTHEILSSLSQEERRCKYNDFLKFMVFSSAIFLFLFLPTVLFLYFFCGKNIRIKNTVLMLASLFFYSWGELNYAIVMIVSIIMNFIIGLLIQKHEGKKRKIYLSCGLTLNLLLLAHFKYTNFLVENLNELLSKFAIDFAIILKNPVHLPIGISFFTFHAISYIIDIYKKKAKAEKDPINMALYISLFPQLIAGPIIRYNTIFKQIRQRRSSLQGSSYGIQRFIIGLGKKVIIANNLGYVVDQIFFYDPANLSTAVIWIAIMLYALQIYYDFSGYSDMAIGLGRIFGFKFLENFNYPYISKSLIEFWRRWHISLSSWFRDYLYIPLGGNKHGHLRTYINLFIVFFLCGLWHGASWNFIIWGLFHGFFLTIERIPQIKQIIEKIKSHLPQKIFACLAHFYFLFIITISWVFFRSVDFSQSSALLHFMLIPNKEYVIGADIFLKYKMVLFLLPLAIFFAAPIHQYAKKFVSVKSFYFKVLSFVFMLAVFLLSIIAIGSNSYNPFIYFQF